MYFKLIALIVLVCSGIVLQLTGYVDFAHVIALARQHVDQTWLVVLIITIQTVLFTFAMAGSSLIWITAVLYTPVHSSLIMTTGTTLGSVAAYYFSKKLSVEWTNRVKHSRVYRILKEEGDFSRLFALRIMPGFPHSIINYSSGVLKLRLTHFIPAVVSGTLIKAYVYSVLIYGATSPDATNGSIDLAKVWPLVAISLTILLVTMAKHRSGKK